jgi:hypothetical protein
VIISDARLLDQVREQPNVPNLLRVRVNRSALDAVLIDRLHELFASRPGRCRIAFELVHEDGTEATIDSGSAVRADSEFLNRVREICGADSVAVMQ